MFINAKTNKCLTIAGGLSTANNVDGPAIRLRQRSVAPLAPDLHRAPGRHLLYQEQADQQVPDDCRGREHRQQRDGSSVRLRQRSVAHLDDQAVCDFPAICSPKLHARLRRVHGDRAVDQALALCKRSAMPLPSHRESRKRAAAFGTLNCAMSQLSLCA